MKGFCNDLDFILRFFTMKILVLGDICGSTGMITIKLNLKKIIEDKNIDFTIVLD